jgi:tetratricopeptide (TPR) repeat protein
VALATAPRAYAITFVALAALFTLTTVVVRAYQAERVAMAREELARGINLAQRGRLDDAITHLRASLALQRRNREAQLALASTLLEEGRPREAGTYLTDTLRNDPANGPANLTRARVARALGNGAEAQGYYERAIYGLWPGTAAARRLDVRFELVEMLLTQGQRDRALGELAQAKADAPADVEVGRRAAQLLDRAAAFREAAIEWRFVASQRPDDREAWAGVAASEFSLRDYAAAITAGERALALGDDAATADRVTTARAVLAADPTGRRVSSAERDRRARALLQEVVRASETCTATSGTAATAHAPGGLTASARALLSSRPHHRGEDGDRALDLAEQLWNATAASCPASATDNRVLTLVMDRITSGAHSP